MLSAPRIVLPHSGMCFNALRTPRRPIAASSVKSKSSRPCTVSTRVSLRPRSSRRTLKITRWRSARRGSHASRPSASASSKTNSCSTRSLLTTRGMPSRSSCARRSTSWRASWRRTNCFRKRKSIRRLRRRSACRTVSWSMPLKHTTRIRYSS